MKKLISAAILSLFVIIAASLTALAADSAAKLVVPPIILPIGAIMSFIGGPVFLFLLFRRKYD